MVLGLSNVRGIARGNYHACAVMEDGTARCWGHSGSGSLGDGTMDSRSVPVAVLGLNSVRSIAPGKAHTCAVMQDNTARCWGGNAMGQLGDGTATDRCLGPVVVSGLSSVRNISVGGWQTCAVLEDGSARCWGYNACGQLGDGTTTSSSVPVVASGLSNARVRSIAAGEHFTCALLEDGTAQCWGCNNLHQLGDGTATGSYVPMPVSGLSTMSSISASGWHTCAILEDNTASCWGWNKYGQLGDGTNIGSKAPAVVSGCGPHPSTSNNTSNVCSGMAEVGCGERFTCAILEDKTVRCWGRNDGGELGDGTRTDSNVPVAVKGVDRARSISVGASHSCAVLTNGTARCWGDYSYGKLGTYSFGSVVPGLSSVRSISAWGMHTCAVLEDGTARCWGCNLDGQLGNASFIDHDSIVPVVVSGLTTVRSIAAGTDYTCAVLTNGTARCWGRNGNGQLGDGTTNNSMVPVAVLGLSNVRSVSVSEWHTCAVLDNGTARCWGYNWYGELGDGTFTGSNVPVVVSGLNNIRSISAGDAHTCAVLEDGSARCWGDNHYGKLGDGTTTQSNVPVVVSGLSNVRGISAGGFHTCAALENGTARCWGWNYHGQLGDGTATDSKVPVVVSGCAPKPTTSNYTECRQVIASEGLLMYSKPCKYSMSLSATIARCQRFEYLAAAHAQVSECANQGDLTCWVEIIYSGTRGWITAGTGTSCEDGSNPSDTALVAYCPAAACPTQGKLRCTRMCCPGT